VHCGGEQAGDETFIGATSSFALNKWIYEIPSQEFFSINVQEISITFLGLPGHISSR
jgi:hypothetical protein